jgi:cyanophycinase
LPFLIHFTKCFILLTEPNFFSQMRIIFSYFVILICFLFSCSKKHSATQQSTVRDSKNANPNEKELAADPIVTTYLTGNAMDTTTKHTGGLFLMGGSTDVDAAFTWFLERAAGGDVVVIRSSGADGYNKYMFNLVPVNSVETIMINSREKASLASVTEKIRNAEALFIAGGDQWNYVNYWKNTVTEDAINYLLNKKQVTVGGTSAGLAILGSAYFSAQNGTVTSVQALSNPYNDSVAIGNNDFIQAPFMQNLITDSHYSQRNRQGRHITFLARLLKDFGYKKVKGIGIDEKTAVCIDQNGIGKVYGINNAYFLYNTNLGAENCISKQSLTWNRNANAISAYRITGSNTGNGLFDAANWTFSGGTSFYYYVNAGVLVQTEGL